MMKMLITLDDDKIIREGKYDINKINAYIDKQFEKRGMHKDADIWYSNGDFSSCGSMSIILSRKEWFLDNIKEWMWIDASDSSVDDLKAFYAKDRDVV